ncbi:hypothetical protein Tco_0588150 [Tanacetum coccineum]
MQKAKKNMRKINFKKAVAQKFREYDQKLKALTNFSVSEAFEKDVQAKVLTEIKKLLPTLIPEVIANYQALDAQDAEPSFHKRSHDNRDSLNNREGENKKKHQKDVSKPSSRSSRRNKSLMVNAQGNTPTMQPLDKEDKYILIKENHILGPYTMVIAKKLKAIIQKDELTIADLEGAGLERLKQQYQNDVELEYHVSQLKAVVLTEAKWNNDEDDMLKPRSFK